MILKFVLFFLCWVAVVDFAVAQDVSDSVHSSISDSISRTADFLDDFFTDERRNVEGSKTQVVVSYANLFDKDELDSHSFSLDARLHLPKTENRFRLLIQNAVRFESEDNDISLPQQAEQAIDEGEYIAALQYVFTESRLWQVSSRAGLTLGVPVDPFVKFRVRRLISHAIFDTRIVQEFNWSESIRFKESTSMEFERILNPDYFSRLRFAVEWGEKDRHFLYVNDLAIFQKFRANLYIKYDAGYNADITQRFDIQRVFINMRFRKTMFKKWIFYEFVPEVFREELDWSKTRFQFLFRIDLVFGKGFE